MKRPALLALLILLLTSPSFPDQHGLRFATITFHDVVDKREGLDADGVTTDRLVATFDFLRGNGWTAISLDDVEQAAKLIRPLPDRAVLITVDDGYRSAYTRVFPLLLAYRMPAVVALVGSWMMQTQASRERYVSWDEAREMQRSGLVEFASHTYDLHHGMLGNPQGSELPTAAFRKYDPILGYEHEDEYQLRIAQDLAKSIDLMKSELGKTPRALVWPYGRYTAAATDLARRAGFTFALTLDSEPADASKPMAIARYLLSGNFDFEKIANDLRSTNRLPTVQRLVRLDPSTVWTPDASETNARLGRTIERIRTLGATSVVIEAAVSDADGMRATWFPNNSLPVRADVFSRFAWQMHTRAGVSVFGRLPVKAALKALKDPDRVLALFRDFGISAPLDGLVLEDVSQLAATKAEVGLESASPWEVRKRRDAVEYTTLDLADALALRCFRVVEAARPRLSLALLTTSQTLSGPSSIADITLLATSGNPKEASRLVGRLKKLGWSQPVFPRDFGFWIESPKPPRSSDLISAARTFQRNGISVIGWADDMIGDRPAAALVAGSVSASSFPVKF
jgi:poly-beta-1,6-N-acetyl-D-glucosamine N-deacetylase